MSLGSKTSTGRKSYSCFKKAISSGKGRMNPTTKPEPQIKESNLKKICSVGFSGDSYRGGAGDSVAWAQLKPLRSNDS